MVYLAFACLAIAALIALGNLGGCLAAEIRRRRGIDRGYSSIPLVCLLLCTLAWVLGGQSIGALAFIPALLDPGTWVLVVLPFVLLREHAAGSGSDSRPRSSDPRSDGRMDTDIALRLLGPMASIAVQRRFVIGGTSDSYGLASEFLDNAYSFIERSRSTPFAKLASVRALATVLDEIGSQIPVSDASITNEMLIEQHPGWAEVRKAAELALREMQAGFDDWERSELELPR